MHQCGEMKLLLGGLLLTSFCALSSWSVSSGTVVVSQSPDVSVLEGETVEITCCWEESSERKTVNWLKNKTKIKRSMHKETSGCSNLTFRSITTEDSGRYTCRVNVDIPNLINYEGNGTIITIIARENTENATYVPFSSPPLLPIIISLAVAAPLVLIAVICFCTLRRRDARAARVIYEVPYIDSEEADVDKHSTNSSTGSSQWCQVPVYEPFYFERMQTKESG